MSKHIIFGISGQVGSALAKQLSGQTVFGTYNNYCDVEISNNSIKLDITDRNSVRNILETCRPDIIWIPAALTTVDYCEANPDISYNINVLGVKNIIDYSNNAFVVFYSSDYIFDGKFGPYTELSNPNPLNIYGKHKLEAERIVKTVNSLIIRTSWVYGQSYKNNSFVHRLVKSLSEGKEVGIREEKSNPTYSEDLAKYSIIMANDKNTKIINIAGKENIDKVSWAKQIANYFKLDLGLIKNNKLNTVPVSRPANGGFLVHEWVACRDFCDTIGEFKNHVRV